MRTAKAMGVRTVAVYSDADMNSMHVQMVCGMHREMPRLWFTLGVLVLHCARLACSRILKSPCAWLLSLSAGRRGALHWPRALA